MRTESTISYTKAGALRLDTIERAAKALTYKHASAIRRVHELGPEAWCEGRGRAGGAVSRMFDRLVAAGLVKGPPYAATPFGIKVLESYDARTSWCPFCKKRHPGGATCMGHYP